MESKEPTPWAVVCPFCSYQTGCETLIYYDYDEYMEQLGRPDCRWACPRCGRDACWDDDNYLSDREEEEESASAEGATEED
jgi:hypothetical protein